MFMELYREEKREGVVRGDWNEMRWDQKRREQASQYHFLMCAPQSGLLRDVHRVIQRRGEGGRRQRWPGGLKREMKRRETDPASKQFPKCSPLSGTHRDSQSWVEKRRGREETETTWWRKRRVQGGETGQASNLALR